MFNVSVVSSGATEHWISHLFSPASTCLPSGGCATHLVQFALTDVMNTPIVADANADVFVDATPSLGGRAQLRHVPYTGATNKTVRVTARLVSSGQDFSLSAPLVSQVTNLHYTMNPEA